MSLLSTADGKTGGPGLPGAGSTSDSLWLPVPPPSTMQVPRQEGPSSWGPVRPGSQQGGASPLPASPGLQQSRDQVPGLEL